jgi:translation initiation factor 6 (eIF-6)
MERRRVFDWKLVVQILSMVVVMGSGLLGVFWKMNERVVIVETQLHEEMKGYQAIFTVLTGQMGALREDVNRRLDRIETRLDERR